MADDPYDLDRFVTAQASVYADVVAELEAGRKESHWMWFVFPQVRGLGFSPMAHRYGIASLDEARAYLAHPVLGPRLRECASLMLRHRGQAAEDILGSPDDLKLRSSMTLFAQAAPDEPAFREILTEFYGGKPDERTRTLLARDR
jgi:uncharacterized protein (DUF1810 family)